MRQGEDKWWQLHKLDMKSIRFPAEYNGAASSGFDIALCAYSDEKHPYNRRIKDDGWKKDIFWGAIDPKDIEVGYKIEVGGYPAEKDGWAHYHRGEITDIKKQDKGGWIVFYNIDSTPGMSGSPIKIVDERFLSKSLSERERKLGFKKIIVGIHTGHDISEGLNYGTLITPAIRKWMHSKCS